MRPLSSADDTVLNASCVGNCSSDDRENQSNRTHASNQWGMLLESSNLRDTNVFGSSWLQNAFTSVTESAPADFDLTYFLVPFGFVSGSALLAFLMAVVFEQSQSNMDTGTKDYNAIYLVAMITSPLFMAFVTIVIPESCNLAESLGYDAISSGYLIGGPYMLTGMYMLSLKPYLDTWSQVFMKKVVVFMILNVAVGALLYALGADPPFDSLTVSMRFHLCMIARTLFSGADGGGMICYLMLLRVTPSQDVVHVSMRYTAAKTIGLGSGPLFSAACSHLFAATTASDSAAYPLRCFAILPWMAFVFACCVLPSSLSNALENKSERDVQDQRASRQHDSELDLNQTLQMAPQLLPASTKRQIWTLGVLIGVQRALVVSSIESATAFILQKEFGWSTREAGVWVCLSLWFGIPVYILKELTSSKLWHTEVTAMRVSGMVATVASLLFLKSVTHAVASTLHVGAGYSILLADAVLYPAAYITSGMMDGFASTIAMPHTSYNDENYYILDNLFQNSFSRGFAPVYARYMLSHYGRDSYAWAQFGNLAISFLSSCIVLPLYLPSPSKTSDEDLGN